MGLLDCASVRIDKDSHFLGDGVELGVPGRNRRLVVRRGRHATRIGLRKLVLRGLEVYSRHRKVRGPAKCCRPCGTSTASAFELEVLLGVLDIAFVGHRVDGRRRVHKHPHSVIRRMISRSALK